MRIDKFLWCVRLAKTRSEAAKLCNNDRVLLDDEIAKPSKVIYAGAQISVRENPVWRRYQVINLPKSRIGAKLVSTHLLDITPQEDLDQLKAIQEVNRINRQQGIKGRPTKKDRRKLDGLQD